MTHTNEQKGFSRSVFNIPHWEAIGSGEHTIMKGGKGQERYRGRKNKIVERKSSKNALKRKHAAKEYTGAP